MIGTKLLVQAHNKIQEAMTRGHEHNEFVHRTLPHGTLLYVSVQQGSCQSYFMISFKICNKNWFLCKAVRAYTVTSTRFQLSFHL